jgi:hypothetical protein
LDPAQLRVVPGSHRRLSLSVAQATMVLTHSKKLELQSGDAVLFHSTLLHGGIFSSRKQNRRRVVQLFDISPTQKSVGCAHPNDRVLHVWTPADRTAPGFRLSRMAHVPGIGGIMAWAGSMTGARGYGYPSFKPPPPFSIISIEAFRTRSQTKGWQESNSYVICAHGCRVYDATVEQNARIRQAVYRGLHAHAIAEGMFVCLAAVTVAVAGATALVGKLAKPAAP